MTPPNNSPAATAQEIVLRYIKNKKDFWNSLNKPIRDNVCFKQLSSSLEMFSDIMLDLIPRHRQLCQENIIPCMLNSKLLFLDYYGTPFYEAMSLNIPIVLAFLETTPFFTKEATIIFQKFEEAGVIYQNVEAAAKFLNQIQNIDIKKWWNDEKIQCIRKEFLEKYANNKPYFWPWVKAIWNRDL